MPPTDHTPDTPTPRIFTEEEVQRALQSTLEGLERNHDYRALGVHDRYNMRGMFVSAARVLLRENGEDMLKRAYNQQLKMSERVPPSRRTSHQLSLEATRHFTKMLDLQLPDASQRAFYDEASDIPAPKPNNSRLLELVRAFDPEQYRMDLQHLMAWRVGPDGRVQIDDYDSFHTIVTQRAHGLWHSASMTEKKHITNGQHQGKLVLQSREALAGQWLDAADLSREWHPKQRAPEGALFYFYARCANSLRVSACNENTLQRLIARSAWL